MKSNSTAIIITTLVIAAGLYWYFFTGTGSQPPLSMGAVQNQSQAQFSTLASQLQSITFDTTVLSDPHFAALSDLATPIIPETSGRLDPFAVIPGVSGK